ncbi:uncharacterized protein TRAVEDRAFT_60876 [Trametes versicolor FP-101664 SS1]|uniref:uncharacterized protein n=1 Tax=Trametes versicolor (strain FP-101664) TaxID=717944 RepID=UPI00046236BE|nr:uncharacterized protein TRAVEDRAFT_60876 [Trametes versicolor FP-101664 SS1]EIW53412.1 hypothetical protein TRAVEDRAFT_60876 [Trametes versicolor FP-101664 SS1]
MKLNLEGFTAHLCCDGVELETYDVQKEDAKTVTCWISSEEGKTFTLHWGEEAAATTAKIDGYVDGRHVCSSAFYDQAEGRCKSLYTAGQERPFVFSPLILTDDILVSSKVDEELGSIRITMTRAQSFLITDVPHPGYKVAEIGAVHEKSKKAGVHAVSFGEVKAAEVVKSCTAVGLEKEPFAIFKFRYRPLELLRANGIVPLPPQDKKGKKRSLDVPDDDLGAGPSSKRARGHSVVKPEFDEDDDDDAEDDVVFLQEQLAMIQKRLADAQAAKRTKTIVKRETSPIIVPSSISDEVIDLT